VGGREPLNVSKAGRRKFLVPTKKQKVRDRQVVQLVRDRRVEAYTIQGIAEDEPGPDVRVVKRLHPHVVAGAEQGARAPVPDGKGKITQEVFDTVLPPAEVGTQDQLDIGSVRQLGLAVQFGDRKRLVNRTSATAPV